MGYIGVQKRVEEGEGKQRVIPSSSIVVDSNPESDYVTKPAQSKRKGKRIKDKEEMETVLRDMIPYAEERKRLTRMLARVEGFVRWSLN